MPDALGPTASVAAEPPVPGSSRWLASLRRLGGDPAATTLAGPDYSAFTEHVAALERELARRAPGYPLAARSRLALLLIDATRALRLGRTPLPPLVAMVLELIEAEFRGPVTVPGLAAAVGEHPSEISRALRSLIGVGPLRLIEERRMVEARRLLLGSDRKIEAISSRAGYRDVHYFRRRFLLRHGVAPATWRQLNR